MSIIKNYVTISLFITIFSGCAAKWYDENAMNDANKTAKRISNYKMDHLSQQIDQVEQSKNDYFVLNENYDLDTVMKKLSLIDKNIYFVKTDKNVIIPASAIKISSFEQLKQYIKAVLDLDLRITQNRFIKSLPKIVELVDDNKALLSLKNINLELSGVTKFEKLIDYINNSTDYTIFLNKQSFKKSTKSGNGLINTPANGINQTKEIEIDDEKILSYKVTMNNWTLAKAINFFKNSLNLFVDVSYDNKIIILSKYKTNTFTVVMPNVNIVYSDALKKDLEAKDIKQPSETQAISTVYAILENKVRNILTSFGENSQSANIDTLTGSLVVTSSSEALKIITKVVNNFNEELSKQAYLRISHYDIILKRENEFGIDFAKTQTKGTNLKNRFVQNQFLFKTVDDGKWSWFIDSIHKYGVLYNIDEYDIILTNNIPYEDNDLVTTKYIASKKTTSTTTNGLTTNIENYETDSYQEGYAVNYLTKVRNNNSVSVKMNITEKKLENIENKVYGTNADSFTLPSVRDVAKSPLVQLHTGEKIIIWQRKYLDIADNYSGSIPIEDFVIGGTSGKSYVLKEYLLFVELIKIKK
jgi:DNA-binding protein YbaB